MCSGIHAKYPLFLLGIYESIFRDIISKITFHENPSSGSRVVSCGLTDRQKLIVSFSTFVKAPKADNFGESVRHYLVTVVPARVSHVCIETE